MSDIEKSNIRRLPTTSWNLVIEAQEGGLALEQFIRRYYSPIFAYIQALAQQRGESEEAEDLAQGFMERIVLSGALLSSADRERGNFRPYLKQAIRNYLNDRFRESHRRKRGGETEFIHPDETSGMWNTLAAPSGDVPDRIYQRAWLRALLNHAIATVEQLCNDNQQRLHFTLFVERYLNESGVTPSWDTLGRPHALDGKKARHLAETVARHFRAVLRETVKQDAGGDHAVDEEIRSLLEEA
jgi:RNA polymerase sigma factor (sigma-70 family)